MPFMQSTSDGGSFKIFASYNAKAGRFYTKPDEQNAEQYEVTNFTAIFDMPNIRTGWFLFAAGVAPAKTFDPSLSQAAPKPGDGFKRGFEVDVFSDKNLGGLREFASTAGIVIDSLNELYDLWESQRGANGDKLPVVKCTGVSPVTNKHGTNYKPKWDIVAWADRPTEMPAGDDAPAPAAAPTPAAGAKHVPPPAPAEADDDAVEF